jgi:hypothetical protein
MPLHFAGTNFAAERNDALLSQAASLHSVLPKYVSPLEEMVHRFAAR